MRREAWLTLVGAILMQLSAGAIFLFGELNIYIASYFHQFDNSVTLESSFYLLLPLALSGAVGNAISVHLFNKFGVIYTLVIGSVGIWVSVIVSAHLTNFYWFILFYGFFFGVTSSICYMQGLGVSWAWFEKQKGLITGVIMLSFASSLLVFSWVIDVFTNPNNEQPKLPVINPAGKVEYLFDSHVANRLPGTLKVMGSIWGVLALGGTALIREHPQRSSSIISPDLSDDEEKAPYYCTVHYWILKLMALMLAISAAFTLFNFKSYGRTVINDDEFLSLVGSICGLGNGVGRLIWGTTADRITFSRSFSFIAILQIAVMGTLPFIKSPTLYLIWIVILQFCAGGIYTVFAPEIMNIYGVSRGRSIYPFFAIAFQLSIILNLIISRYIVPALGYTHLFYVFTGLTILGLILHLAYLCIKNAESDDTLTYKQND
jgi:MFS family permease